MRSRNRRRVRPVQRAGRLHARLERACARWGITVRKGVAAGLLPIVAAMQQTFVARLAPAPACEVGVGATGSAMGSPLGSPLGSATPAGGSVVAAQGPSKVVLTLASGMVVASHAIMVTATLCGPAGQLASPSSVAVRVDVAGGLGTFTMVTTWGRARPAERR